ncbi:MAG: DUF6985 domain-containing protein [Solirubrobacterales bacterium]
MFIKNINKSELFELEGQVYFDLFCKDIQVFIEEDSNLNYAEQCAIRLNSVNEDIINSLCLASIRYCNNFLDDIGEDTLKFDKVTDVLTLITPSSMSVPIPQNGSEPVVNLELNCTWEEEHGLQWIIRGDKVVYVGAYNGVDPWGDCDIGEEWNYV